jgi:hypothetical protein
MAPMIPDCEFALMPTIVLPMVRCDGASLRCQATVEQRGVR